MKQLTSKDEPGVLVGRFVSRNSAEIWKTSKGDRAQLAFMHTNHLFYAFRMLYDRIAEMEKWPTMRAKGEGEQANKKLTRSKLARIMAAFAGDIVLRADLAEEHLAQFAAMMGTVLGARPFAVVQEALNE